eukprot:CAMPEP_0181337224 /NCGR_PEP_ID=MMETSP1101-20121128/27886_1 /TAXON_ID=46948 /ORGANISM="Rhodomonas abbreviata, Strain Caron Lab Isolate" /LENGTH=155 /DNA_ID=CAMNT_0023447667 /DNA_START=58 /DNA_END=522 /DNA_ORIENTATION=-
MSKSTAALTQFTISTPATPPGDYDVTLQPRVCADPCPDSVSFTFTQIDPTLPELFPPIPTKGQLQSHTMPRLTLSNFPSVSPLDVFALFTHKDTSVGYVVTDTALEINSGVAYLTVHHPEDAVSGVYTVTISIMEDDIAKTVDFEYELFDATLSR